MIWKANTIVIRPALLGADPDEILGHLGYGQRRRIGERIAFGKAGGSIWIGAIDDRIIMHTYLADGFFDGLVDDPLDQDFKFFKSALLRHFREADIAALFLNGTVDAWGFSVFRDGALVRRFYGHDGSILGDEGSRLPVEDAYFANCDRIEVDGEVLYKTHHPGVEPLSLAYHGEGLLWDVWRSFTGYELDAPELWQIPGSVFWLNDDEEEFRRRNSGRDELRPWWKFWG